MPRIALPGGALALALILAVLPAGAFDASKYPSPTFNAPQVDKLTIQSPGSTGDASGLSIKAPDATSSRSLTDRIETLSARDFGMDMAGTGDDTSKLQALIDAVAARGGGIAFVPPGTVRLAGTSAIIQMKSNVRLVCAGKTATTILYDDTLVNASRGAGIYFNGITDAGIEHCRIKGSQPFSATNRKHLVASSNAKRVWLRNVRLEDSSLMGAAFVGGDQVEVTDSTVYHTNYDGISVQDIPNAIVSRNTIVGANDDSISAHVNDSAVGTLRSGLVITNNHISESQGIAVYGAKAAVISGNVMRRMMSYGLMFNASSSFAQGNTPAFAVTISDNVILDVFARSGETTPKNGYSTYMHITGGPKQAGTGNTAPPNLYGTGAGNLYVNAPTTATASPGGYWWNIVNNTLARTKPASTAWSDWGDVDSTSGLFDGSNNGGLLYTGGITEAALNARGITIAGPLANSRIAGNLIQTTGDFGIYFSAATPAALDYDEVAIENNRIADFGRFGVFYNASTAQRVPVRDNTFDGDPRQAHANRGAGGTWATNAVSTAPYGVYAPNAVGFVVERNSFRNVASAVLLSATAIQRDNLVYAQPAAVGFSTANKGVGTIPRGGRDWTTIVEDSDPASATYRQILSAPVFNASAMPASGTYVPGHVVTNTSATSTSALGWARLTLGSGHVLGTDWRELTPGTISSYTVNVTPATGAFATAPTTTGEYVCNGKLCDVRVLATFGASSIGTAAGGYIDIDLPFPAAATGWLLVGVEDGVTGKMVRGMTTSGSSTMRVRSYDNLNLAANSAVFRISGRYAVQ